MYIQSYETKRFAGLKNKKIDFEDGINVILGPNESGKSSIINGIHSTLFQDIKLKMNNNKDKEFIFKYMPLSGGDFIDGRLVLNTEEGQYKLLKKWGSNSEVELETPSGNLLRDEEAVYNKLNDILSFGESTYSNIVFAKQKDLKKAINNIISDGNVTKEINDLLRRALMELDGVSIDKIQDNINNEIDSLYKRWDIDKNYPENNRGVNNPYKVGLGLIIESYYEKENLKLLMDEANLSEKNYENVCDEIKKNRDEKEKIDLEKNQLESIEEDINNRMIIETEMNSIKKDLDIIMNINTQWPKDEQTLVFIQKELLKIEKELEDLNKEKEKYEKYNRKKYLEEKINRVKKILKEIEELEKELNSMSKINKIDLDLLKKYNQEILNIQTAIKAGKIIATLKKSPKNPILVYKDFEEKEELELNKSISAKGLLKIEYNNELEIEIKTGEVDFEELSLKYKDTEEKYKDLLLKYNMETLEKAEESYKLFNEKESSIESLNEKVKLLLADEELKNLEEELESLEDIQINISLDKLQDNINKLVDSRIENLSSEKSVKKDIDNWISIYETKDKLFDLVIEKRTDYKIKEKELLNLDPLPDRFNSADDFKRRLRELKEISVRKQDILNNLNRDYIEAKTNLLDETYEELKKSYINAQNKYNRFINRGKKLLEIKEVFLKVKENLSSNPMEPLVKEFERLLNTITENSFDDFNIDEEFNINLNRNNKIVPIELLSAGTYDAVTLALRFALLKYIFEDEKGYVVLDDCLVDLDPKRKEKSVKIIHEFAKEYQVIFTTCDPDTAKLLGGNIIKL